MKIGEIIASQLGGTRKLNAMTGAYNFMLLENGLSFRLKNPSANYVKIELNGKDLYDVEIGRVRGGSYKIVQEYHDIYNDQLKEVIEMGTGMYLSLEDGGAFGAGHFAEGGILSSYEIEKLDNGFTIEELSEMLNNKFRYSFQFEVYKQGKNRDLTTDYDNKLKDDKLKLKFYDKTSGRDLNYEVMQGEENTYFHFLLSDSEYNGYVGTFGFKDRGDVSKEYVTKFVAFLHDAYHYPFSVKHSVMENGGAFGAGHFARGGSVGKNPFEFLKKYKGFKYQIEEKKDGGIILSIQKDGEKGHIRIYNTTDDKNLYGINSVSVNIGDEIGVGQMWYGEEKYTLSGVILRLKLRGCIEDKITKITKYPTTYTEFLILMNDYEPINQFGKFLGNEYNNFNIWNRDRIYNSYQLPFYRYFNVKGYLTPCYWSDNDKGLLTTLFGSANAYLEDKTLFGTRIGQSSSGNYGSKQGFINSGEKYLIGLRSASKMLDIKDWQKVNEKDIELDSKFLDEIKLESKKNFKIIINKMNEALEKNKAFQDYLKGIDSESLKGKGLKQGDSILESSEKYVKVKTKDGDEVYVVLATGNRTFGKPTSYADGGAFGAGHFAEGGMTFNPQIATFFVKDNDGKVLLKTKSLNKASDYTVIHKNNLSPIYIEAIDANGVVKKVYSNGGAFGAGHFAEGGDINAFTMQMVKGTGNINTEVITEERKISFEKGGSLQDKIAKLESKKSELESKLFEAKLKSNEKWNNIGFGSGMRKSKINLSTKREDSLKERITFLEEEIKQTKDSLLKKPYGKYIPLRDIKTVTIKKGGKELTYKGADTFDGAYVLEDGGGLKGKAFYTKKADVVKVTLNDGSEVMPVNGFWIKKTAEPIDLKMTKSMDIKFLPITVKVYDLAKKEGITYEKLGNEELEQQILQALVEALVDANFHGEAKEMVAKLEGEPWSDKLYKSIYFKPSEKVGNFGRSVAALCEWDGIAILNAFYYISKMEGNKAASFIEKFTSTLEYENGGAFGAGHFAMGGKVTFDEKSAAIAKNFVGKSVQPKYQSEYGETYSKEEASEVGDKIAGAQRAKYESKPKPIAKKKASGGLVIGNPKMKAANDLAKQIRKDGEKWSDALKRAHIQLKG